MNHEINPIVYILIERTERELDSKLLAALFLLKKGFHVVLGHQWALTENRDCLPAGIFFFKGMNKIHTQWMAKVCQFEILFSTVKCRVYSPRDWGREFVSRCL